MERKSLRIPDDDDEDDHDDKERLVVEVPTSPTDSLLSPCSNKILRKNNPLGLNRRTSKMSSFSLNVDKVMPPTDRDIVLGTSSKSRQKIVSMLGWEVSIIIPDINEKAIRTDDPLTLPLEVARAKAAEVLRKLSSCSDRNGKECIVITADQIVYFNNEIREKPIDEHEAKRFLASYSNSDLSTISAIVVTHYPSGREKSEVDVSKLYWNEIPDKVVDKVVAKGSIFQSAGGFRIEDEDLNPLISKLEGSVSCLMGLNVVTLKTLIKNLETEILTTLE